MLIIWKGRMEFFVVVMEMYFFWEGIFYLVGYVVSLELLVEVFLGFILVFKMRSCFF